MRNISKFALAFLLFAGQAFAQSGGPTPVPAYNGKPYFSAYISSNQSVSANVITKGQFNAVNFDSGGYYDNVTNFRYTPLLAGKYLFHVVIQLNATLGGSSSLPIGVFIYKNGSSVAQAEFADANGNAYQSSEQISVILQMNGSTDYIEGFGLVASGVGSNFFNGNAATSFIEGTYIGP